MKLNNIELLIDGSGEISIGRVGSVRCAACASDENQSLAMLARRPGESLFELLKRLDRAVEDAMERQVFADEINR